MIDEKFWRSSDPNANYPEQHHGKGYKIEPEWSVNPWESFPRNSPCFCDSGKKFKKCHLPQITPVIETSKIPEIKRLIAEILGD